MSKMKRSKAQKIVDRVFRDWIANIEDYHVESMADTRNTLRDIRDEIAHELGSSEPLDTV